MKVKKPSEQKVKDTIALAGGAIAGGAVSKGLFGLIHKSEATEAEAMKKEENTALLKRGGLAIVGVGGALFLDGTDTITTLVKGVAVGVATIQTLEIIKTLAARSGVADESTADSTGKKFLARTVGLGCPDNAQSLNAFQPSFRYDLSQMDAFVPEPAEALNGWGNTEKNGLLGWSTLQLDQAV